MHDGTSLRNVHLGVGNIDKCIEYSIESSVGSSAGEVCLVALAVDIGWCPWLCTIITWYFGISHSSSVKDLACQQNDNLNNIWPMSTGRAVDQLFSLPVSTR